MDAHRLLSRVLGLWRCYKNDICYCCGYYCLKVAFIQLSSPLPAQFLSTSTAGLTLLIFFAPGSGQTSAELSMRLRVPP